MPPRKTALHDKTNLNGGKKKTSGAKGKDKQAVKASGKAAAKKGARERPSISAAPTTDNPDNLAYRSPEPRPTIPLSDLSSLSQFPSAAKSLVLHHLSLIKPFTALQLCHEQYKHTIPLLYEKVSISQNGAVSFFHGLTCRVSTLKDEYRPKQKFKNGDHGIDFNSRKARALAQVHHITFEDIYSAEELVKVHRRNLKQPVDPEDPGDYSPNRLFRRAHHLVLGNKLICALRYLELYETRKYQTKMRKLGERYPSGMFVSLNTISDDSESETDSDVEEYP